MVLRPHFTKKASSGVLPVSASSRQTVVRNAVMVCVTRAQSFSSLGSKTTHWVPSSIDFSTKMNSVWMLNKVNLQQKIFWSVRHYLIWDRQSWMSSTPLAAVLVRRRVLLVNSLSITSLQQGGIFLTTSLRGV